MKFLGIFRKYLVIATGASILANAALWYAWRGAESEQEAIRAECVANVATGANTRWEELFAAQAAAAEAREAQLQEQRRIAEQAAINSAERAEIAEVKLRNFVTEQLRDSDSEYTEWADTKLPSSVVDRLQEIIDE